MKESKRRNENRSAIGPLWETASQFYWNHLIIRCASPACSLRLNLQPAVLARFRGIHFNNRWYHETACLKEALVGPLRQMLLNYGQNRNRGHRFPLGLLLVKRGVITPSELREGLRLQRQAGAGKLGYWLRRVTPLDEDKICAALGQQWGCPVFPLDRQTSPASLELAPPYPLLAAAKAIPAFATADGLQWHIAFSERVDHSLLYALEEILSCRTYACVSRESAVNEALEQFRKLASGNEICFDSVRDPSEMAATICSYVAQMDVRQVKVVRAAGFIWVAFLQRGARKDLLFRVASEPNTSSADFPVAQIKAFPIPADNGKDGVVDVAGQL
jgi:hypothetical protein